LTSSIVDADIASAANIAYSKLALSNSIVNADVSSSAAIAYSKLALSNSIVNTDVSSSAAIAFSKLASLTSAHILVGNGSAVATDVAVSGDLTLANTGAFTVAKIAGTTVAGTTGTVNAVFSASPTITGTLTAATISASGAVTGSNLSGSNSGDVSLTAVGSTPNGNGASLSGQALTLQPANTSFPGVLTAADWNTFNSKLTSSLASANIFVGNGSGVATAVAVSGDLTLANTGAFTIASAAVTASKLATVTD
jgi:hypothetical protein